MSVSGVLSAVPLDPQWLSLLGPIAWGLFAWAFASGRRRMGRLLNREGDPLPDPPPRVTILVPVKDEAGGIEACVGGLLAQDYPAFDVLVADDRSTDGTGAILDRLAGASAGRLAVIHLTDLPAGWLGKPHALHMAVARDGAGLGEWLLLVDSDVVAEPDALRRVVARAAGRDYALLSLVTGLIAPTFLEKLVPPLAAAAWASTFRVADTNDDNRATAAANGQFMLVRREALLAVGGHAAVRDKTCEDVELARLIKATGRQVRFFQGQPLAATRMHAGYWSMFNGWARNFAGTARHRPAPLLAALAVLWFGAAAFVALPAALAAGWWIACAAAAAQAAVTVGLMARVYRDSRMTRAASVGLALLFPAAVVLFTPMLLNGVRACFGGRVHWRGSAVRA